MPLLSITYNISLGAHLLLRTYHSVIHYMQALVFVRTCYCALATLFSITYNISLGAHMLLRTYHSVIHFMQALVFVRTCYCASCHSVIHYMQTLVLVRTCYCALATLLSITCNISFGAHVPMLSITYISLGARMLLRTCHSVIHYMQHQSWCAHATAHMPLSYFSSDTVEMSNSAYRRYCIEQ